MPDNPIIPRIEGDGIGPDISRAAVAVGDASVELAYGGKRKNAWFEIFAGEKAQQIYGKVLPSDTFKAIEHFIVAIKGPLTTPVAGGYRSLNVTLRQKLDLYACVRPVRWIEGVPSPVIGDYIGLFEATHGTAPKYAGQDKVNPGSLILSGVMMLQYLGWKEAADLIIKGITETVKQKKVTYDLERQMEGATKVKTSEFGNSIVANMKKIA